LFKNNKLKLDWTDKIVSVKDDHLIRQIGNTFIDYKDRNILQTRTILKKSLMTKIGLSGKLDNKIIAADLETYIDHKVI